MIEIMKENITLEELTTILTETEEAFTETTDLDKAVIEVFKNGMLHGYKDCNFHNVYGLVKGFMDVIESDFKDNIIGKILKIIIGTFIEKSKKYGYFEDLK